MPILLCAGLSAVVVQEYWKLLQNSSATLYQSQLISHSAALVHELQKERGMSASLLASEGKLFRSELDQQRQQTNAMRAELERHLDEVEHAQQSDIWWLQVPGRNTADDLADIRAHLIRLDYVRDSVDKGSITHSDMLAFYSEGNALLMQNESAHSSSTTMEQAALSLQMLSWSKEYAGLERALLARFFSRGAYSAQEHRLSIELAAKQQTYLEASAAIAQKADLLERVHGAQEHKEVLAFRALIQTPNTVSAQFLSTDPAAWFAVSTQRIELLKALEHELSNELVHIAEAARAHSQQALQLGAIALVLCSSIAAMLCIIVTTRTARRLHAVEQVTHNINKGQYNTTISDSGTDEMGALLNTLRDLQRRLNISAQAMDSASSNIMIIDSNLTITYMNTAMRETLRLAENDIRTILPHFNSEKLMGECIDVFHTDPSHQRAMLTGMTRTVEVNLHWGTRSMHLQMAPLIGSEERHIGYVAEWVDRTEEVAIEQEINDIVAAAKIGQLDRRITVEGRTGFFGQLGGQVNALLSTNQQVIGDLNEVLGGMAEGRLSRRITNDYQGEFGRLKNATNQTLDQLEQVIKNINQSSIAVCNFTQQLAVDCINLSARAESQASELQTTSSSMEQITCAVTMNAENANNAKELSAEASEQAQHGGEMVRKTIASMRNISMSSEQIVEIIGVIDDIAFQTNLLALNAAVEAARAGDHGKGFAVVASEVRNLSQRSSQSAQEIKELINTSVALVKEGTDLANESGTTLEAIVESVSQVSELIEEIAHSAQEQSIGVSEINRAVSKIDAATQQSAILVDKTTKSSQTIGKQSQEMLERINFFEVGGGTINAPQRGTEVSEWYAFSDLPEQSLAELPTSHSIQSPQNPMAKQLIEQLDAGIASHSAWTMRLRNAIASGRVDGDIETIRAGNRCDFGQWLGALPQTAQQGQHYYRAVRLHNDFHQHAARVAELALAGQTAQAEKMIEVSGDYTQTSTQLIQCLLAWKNELSS